MRERINFGDYVSIYNTATGAIVALCKVERVLHNGAFVAGSMPFNADCSSWDGESFSADPVKDPHTMWSILRHLVKAKTDAVLEVSSWRQPDRLWMLLDYLNGLTDDPLIP